MDGPMVTWISGNSSLAASASDVGGIVAQQVHAFRRVPGDDLDAGIGLNGPRQVPELPVDANRHRMLSAICAPVTGPSKVRTEPSGSRIWGMEESSGGLRPGKKTANSEVYGSGRTLSAQLSLHPRDPDEIPRTTLRHGAPGHAFISCQGSVEPLQ
jgi:hypothetical protein